MGAWGRLMLASSVVLLAGCTTTASGGSATPTSASASGGPAAPTGATATTASATAGCGSRVETGSLPDWADAGFHGDARVPHVFGAKGDIVAVLFAHPLRLDRKDGSNNKILWVAQASTTSPDPTSPATLVITATLDGTDTRVTREVAGGPGPSIIDMPQAGCWHLDLRWSGHTDTMDLVYAP
ncbi:hypothetical protein JOD64_000013 [Micromonospora luteifusca]|uniref:Uncharacterized protein n=1 Tax=Micromonospora luteifusca TaxID=709860 RepID=A0ABS2LKU2_9ACTN|nr:hypothetical protein [Micromonospora luteifusca]MBM7488791.1 hypothetical protein [Micromonospora luteifusca]